MANYTELNKYLINTPVENGKKISAEDYKQINDILRAAFYSVIDKNNFYIDRAEPSKRVHVTKMATGSILFLKSKEARRICKSVINKLETKIRGFEKDKAALRNIWQFAEFSLKNGKSFVFENLAKEGKMINWEALTDKLLQNEFNFEQSELMAELYEKAKELSIKYNNSPVYDDETTTDLEK